MLMESEAPEELGLAGLDSGHYTEASYDFYGVKVRIRSEDAGVVSGLNSVYHFFRDYDVEYPHLEMTIRVKERPHPLGKNLVFARVPASFDGWRTALLNKFGPCSGWRKATSYIQEVAVPDPSGEGHHFYQINEIDSTYIDLTAGVEFLVFHFVMHFLPQLSLVHAGVVGKNGQALLISGPPNSGKSVLSYALVRSGFRYLSDEFGLFAPASLEVFPFPRGISFKPEAASLFPELGAILGSEDVVWRQEKRHLVSLNNLGFPVTREPARASFLFLLSRQDSALPRLTPIAAPEAAERLLKTGNFWTISPRESRSFTRTEAAARLCDNARCYELLSGDLDRTVALITSVCDNGL